MSYKFSPKEASEIVLKAHREKVANYREAVRIATESLGALRKNAANRKQAEASLESIKKHLEFSEKKLQDFEKVGERVEELMAIQDQIEALVEKRRQMFPGILSPEVTIRSAMRNGFIGV